MAAGGGGAGSPPAGWQILLGYPSEAGSHDNGDTPVATADDQTPGIP